MGKSKMGKWEYTEKELDRMDGEATRRGRKEMADEARARAVHYDRATGRLVIDLMNGATFIVPADLIQGLRGAAPNDIAEVRLGPRNAHLWWHKLDVQFTVDALLAGVFGTKRWMNEMARQMGRKGSGVKRRVARQNGRRAGGAVRSRRAV